MCKLFDVHYKTRLHMLEYYVPDCLAEKESRSRSLRLMDIAASTTAALRIEVHTMQSGKDISLTGR